MLMNHDDKMLILTLLNKLWNLPNDIKRRCVIQISYGTPP